MEKEWLPEPATCSQLTWPETRGANRWSLTPWNLSYKRSAHVVLGTQPGQGVGQVTQSWCRLHPYPLVNRLAKNMEIEDPERPTFQELVFERCSGYQIKVNWAGRIARRILIRLINKNYIIRYICNHNRPREELCLQIPCLSSMCCPRRADSSQRRRLIQMATGSLPLEI